MGFDTLKFVFCLFPELASFGLILSLGTALWMTPLKSWVFTRILPSRCALNINFGLPSPLRLPKLCSVLGTNQQMPWREKQRWISSSYFLVDNSFSSCGYVDRCPVLSNKFVNIYFSSWSCTVWAGTVVLVTVGLSLLEKE